MAYTIQLLSLERRVITTALMSPDDFTPEQLSELQIRLETLESSTTLNTFGTSELMATQVLIDIDNMSNRLSLGNLQEEIALILKPFEEDILANPSLGRELDILAHAVVHLQVASDFITEQLQAVDELEKLSQPNPATQQAREILGARKQARAQEIANLKREMK